ncbi:putative molibdopterin-dependent oxidoreductase YjgC [Marisediminicola sp. UYEF4]|uniref:(2Fe-2S)-binding protein n=1 Tax=Marisediminicola sp. UYEF4 TaxID=1756384 RepID=UPI00339ADE5D
MSPRMLPAGDDPIRPAVPTALAITLDGERLEGIAGQSIAGVILASGRLGFRRTSAAGRPRGIFCGIGVCFDCLVEVDGARDVRACQRRAVDGNVVVTQHDALPVPPGSERGGRDD